MILFVDDQPDRMHRYIDEIASRGLRTRALSSLTELQLFLQHPDPSLRCIVLDVMFPRDSVLPDELTSAGQTTGVPLFASLRSTFPATPIVVFTNSSSIEVKNFFLNQKNCFFLYKSDLLPAQLAELIVGLVEDRGRTLVQELQSCPAGIAHATAFEVVGTKILEYLFIPPLEKVVARSRRSDGHEVRDLVLPNRSGSYFWDSLRREFHAKYIVAEFKNYTKPINKQQVIQLRTYLQRKSLGRFGLLISRQPVSASALTSRADAYQEQDCLILFLYDEDLRKMIELRRTGGDPTSMLETMKEEFELSF